MSELRELVTRTRKGMLRSGDVSSATITVTNLGDQGVESLFGVIIPPQVAIGGIGRITDRRRVVMRRGRGATGGDVFAFGRPSGERRTPRRPFPARDRTAAHRSEGASVNQTDYDALCRNLLADIAPDADLTRLRPDDDLRDRLDLDSVDFLNFVTAIYAATGIEIPEADYGHVCSLAQMTEYLASR